MEHYSLQANESVIYKNKGRLLNKSNKKLESDIELVLTNLYLVFIKIRKKVFSEQVEIEGYPIEEIKIYNELPQIKQDATCVVIYLTSGEKTVELFSRMEVRKFINCAYELLTGETQMTRGAGKVKNAIGLVDDALGIDTVGTIQSVVENGIVGTLIGKGKKKQTKVSDMIPSLVDSSKIIDENNEGDLQNLHAGALPASSIDDDLNAIKKLKDLLDTGIISQEEFDAKKRQILGL